jgi:adenylate cyclase
MTHEVGSPEANPPPVDRLTQLWRRINEHKLVQWTVAYIAVAYALQQGLVLMDGAFDWPDAVLRASMLLMILGLPLVVTLAWYHGERASRHFSAAEMTIISLLLVISAAFFYAFVQPQAEVAAEQVPPAQQTGVDQARAAAASVTGGVSIAVLPFANLSDDRQQEFFSDGMTDEIAGALARVPDLRVVARSSAFEFKGQNREARAMGQALNATHLIQGSVRTAGNRVRITAQLVQAENGLQVWSENYDRELTDVFAIQEEIARAIAGSLRMPLGLRPGENLVASRTINVDLYQQYLRLRAQGRADPRVGSQANVLQELEKLVARDANFAPAWGYMSRLYIISQGGLRFRLMTLPVDETRQQFRVGFDKAEKAAREALRLDPRQALAYATLSEVEINRKNWGAAEDLLLQALDIDPYDPDVLASRGWFFMRTGRVKEALASMEQARVLEPLAPGFRQGLVWTKLANGQVNESIALLEGVHDPRCGYFSLLAQTYAMAGRYDDAANAILSGCRNTFGDPKASEEAASLIRSAPTKVNDPASLPALHVWLSFVYGFVGTPERIMDYPERELAVDNQGFNAVFAATFIPVRKTERFKTYVRNVGLVDYWKARGWPELCKPVGANNFECS